MDGRRRRYRKPKDDKVGSNTKQEQQPKILLKTKPESKTTDLSTVTAEPLKTIIVKRSESAQSPSPNITKEQQHLQSNESSHSGSASNPQIVEPVPQMTRPATIISSTGFINASAKKLFMKNSDFLVVGVIGTQGVGKSTICNLLANEDPNFDYITSIFKEEDGIFPTKLKHNKCSARSRTESTHMFITKDRLILLDSPPVLCNSYKKDMITNELDDLRQIIAFLSVCHLLIVVHDDYFLNMSFMRLLHFAELMKPSQDNKPFINDFLPNLLFVKNRAKRQDFLATQKTQMDQMLKSLRIFRGQTTGTGISEQKSRKARNIPETERIVNSFLLPEVKADSMTSSYHSPFADLIEELRNMVFMTPRSEMYAGPNELTECMWFDLLSKVAQESQHFFIDTYEEIYHKHLEIGSAGANRGDNKTNLDNWTD